MVNRQQASTFLSASPNGLSQESAETSRLRSARRIGGGLRLPQRHQQSTKIPVASCWNDSAPLGSPVRNPPPRRHHAPLFHAGAIRRNLDRCGSIDEACRTPCMGRACLSGLGDLGRTIPREAFTASRPGHQGTRNHLGQQRWKSQAWTGARQQSATGLISLPARCLTC